MKFIVVIFLAVLALLSVSSVSAQNGECEFCEFVVSYIDNFVKQNKTTQYITKEVEKLCVFAGSNEETCKQLVSGYIGEIIILIENYELPGTICQQIGFCTSSEEKQVTGGLKCTVCKFLLDKIEHYITEGKTEQEIISSLDHDCKDIGHGLSSICESVVDEYASQIITLILNKENPNQICGQLHLC